MVKVEDLQKGKFYSRVNPDRNCRKVIFEADVIEKHNEDNFSVNYIRPAYFKKSGAIEFGSSYDYDIVMKGTEYEEISKEDYMAEIRDRFEEILKEAE